MEKVTLKAFGIRNPDNVQNITLIDIPVPEIDDHEVLVQVHAVGVGIHDRWALPATPNFPFVIGLEGSGVIKKVGSAVTAFAPGDRVLFSSSQQPKGGTWAEYAAVPAAALIEMPDGLEFSEGAALPVAGMTALEGIKTLSLDSGNTVFMAGASGANGTLAIQLAVQRGWRVAASASLPNHNHLHEMGAELTVDYRDPEWPQQVRAWTLGGVDGALAIQPGTGVTSMAVVRDGGKVVTVSGDQVQPERGITFEQVLIQEETHVDLAQLVNDVAAGRIRVVLDHVYPFEQGLDALKTAETRHARGKLIITIAGG